MKHWILSVLLAALVACASTGRGLVAADRAVHAAVVQTQDTANRLCDRKLVSEPACKQFNADLVPVIRDADAFNRAVRADSSAEIPTMIASLTRLATSVKDMLPDDVQLAALKQQLADVLALLRSLGGQS